MTKESMKQMTWHKIGRRYSDTLTHRSDNEAWTRFDGIHGDKALEAYNVGVALAADGLNPFEITVAPHTCWPMFVILPQYTPGIVLQW
jgi:hypothetical protein